MSEYSVEEARDRARRVNDGKAEEMLNAYADMIERAREGVTDEVERVAIKAAEVWARENGFVSYMAPTGYIRAALQAVAHLLLSGERGGVEADVFAYGAPDGRVIPKGTRDTAIRDGGASKSSTDIYTIPLYPRSPAQAARVNCSLGVGCDEVGGCYADAHGQPEQCGRTTAEPVAQGEAVDVKLQAHRYFVDTYTNSLNPANADHVFKAFTAGFELAQAIAAKPHAVPDRWRASVKYAIEVLEAEAEIRDNDDTGNKTMKRHTRLLKRMLAAAPSPGESA